ncbi:MAG: hypothetical protein OXG55_09090 [bacterium]|nr:hypothetical protein [bacterium]
MMARTAATRAATGLILLVLVAGACTVNIDVDPGIDLDSGDGTDGSTGGLQDSVLGPNAAGSGSSGSGTSTAARDAAPAVRVPDRGDESPVILINPPPTATTDPVVSGPAPADPAGGSTVEAGDTEATATAGDTTPTTATTADEASTPTTATAAAKAPSGDEDLPGEPYEYGPDKGTSLAVVGVDHDDVLNVRDVPFGAIIATLGLGNPIAYLLEVREMPSGEPIAHFESWDGAIVATGRTRKLPTTVWHEVQVAGVTGWASGAYLAPIGLTDDITAHLIDRLGERPEARTLTELALIVGEVFASGEPPSRVVVTVGPSIFEALGEMTVDVLNLGDDSLRGYRLHIFATPAGDWMSEDPGPFTLRAVERTILCYSHRGVTTDGLCV